MDQHLMEQEQKSVEMKEYIRSNRRSYAHSLQQVRSEGDYDYNEDAGKTKNDFTVDGGERFTSFENQPEKWPDLVHSTHRPTGE